MASISHRGPDGDGEFLNDWVQLGAVRLAVVDVKSGTQPVGGCHGRVQVVCNGEIYNHHALRQRLVRDGHSLPTACDIETIPHLYEEHGSSFVELLRGMFAIALWDEKARKVLVIRDRLGIKPIYLLETPDYLLFASEMKAILASGLIEPEIDADAIEDLFTLSYPCPPRTLIRGIREFLPASVMEIDCGSGRISQRRYWRCPFPPRGEHPRISWRQAGEELRTRLELSVYSHLMSDVPVGVYLSGGLDSSAIAALYREVTGDAPTTFSISFDLPKFDEAALAARTSSFLGATSHFVRCGTEMAKSLEKMVWQTELPLQFPLALPLMDLAGLARSRGFPVVLTGEGADEIFGGYDAFRAEKMRRLFDRRGLRAIRRGIYSQLYAWHSIPEGTVDQMLENHRRIDDVRRSFGGVVPPWFDMWTAVGLERDQLLVGASRRPRSVWDAPDGFDALLPPDVERMDPHDAGISIELATRLPAWILLIGDRSSMAAGVEARVPFLDHEVVEFVASIPPAMKLHRLREKALLRHAVRRMLPKSIVRRPKRPFFTPIEEWFFKERCEPVSNALSPHAIAEAGLCDADLIGRFVRQLRVVPENSLLRHRLEWTLMLVVGVQIFHRQFIKERCAFGPRITR